MSEATMTEATKTTNPEAIDIKSMNIFQRVAAITDELGVVAKNLSVSAGKGSYKAVSERDVIDAVKPLETKYRVYSYASDRVILESENLETEKNYNGNITKTTTFFTRIQTTFTFINIDDPKDRFTTTVFSEGIDTGDKGSGKAMTYADKYALMKAYKISTGDDPDQNPSEENNYRRAGSGYGNNGNQNQGQNRGGYGQNQGNYGGNQGGYGQNQGGYGNNRGYQPPQPTPPPQSNQDAPGIKIKCKNCGNLITDAKRPDGSVATASEVAYFSMQQFGLEYCASCQNKLRNMRNGQGQPQGQN